MLQTVHLFEQIYLIQVKRSSTKVGRIKSTRILSRVTQLLRFTLQINIRVESNCFLNRR